MKLFREKHKVIVGMVHLLPLPGSPRYAGSIEAILDAALADASALAEGGVDALIVENLGDLPYPTSPTPLPTLLAMTRIAAAVCDKVKLPIGINVRFNDFRSELAMALACAATFVRVEAFVDNLLTDSGIIPACAADATRYRQAIGAAGVQIWADVQVKESMPLGERPLVEAARAAQKNLAEAIIVTGQETGAETPLEAVKAVKSVVRCPVLVGSGVNVQNAASMLAVADGAIVGSALKFDGKAENRVDRARVRALMDVLRK